MPRSGLISLHAHLSREQQEFPDAEPGFPNLLGLIGTTAKAVARETRRGALGGHHGLAGERNPSGDAQTQLDLVLNDLIVATFRGAGLVAAIVSEEASAPAALTWGCAAPYLLAIDPLDGSSNTETNGGLGTIFGLYRRRRMGPCSDLEPELREGADLTAAGYVLYGPSTVLVYTRGTQVNGFTLDADTGEFVLSHPDIRCPARGTTFSANLGYRATWAAGVQRFVDALTAAGGERTRSYSLRYSGALVADVHRILLQGGIYFYPADAAHATGKLRLLYEAAPLAFVFDTAHGRASTGTERIADLRVESLHQSVPLAIGSRADVRRYERCQRDAATRRDGPAPT